MSRSEDLDGVRGLVVPVAIVLLERFDSILEVGQAHQELLDHVEQRLLTRGVSVHPVGPLDEIDSSLGLTLNVIHGSHATADRGQSPALVHKAEVLNLTEIVGEVELPCDWTTCDGQSATHSVRLRTRCSHTVWLACPFHAQRSREWAASSEPVACGPCRLVLGPGRRVIKSIEPLS